MYNAELKTNFIKSYTASVNTATIATTVFDAVEQYENEWGADLCTQSTENYNPLSMRFWGCVPEANGCHSISSRSM